MTSAEAATGRTPQTASPAAVALSLCIPAYQAERFIRTALVSCLAQTEPPHEIIVSDDFSSDGTRDIIQEFGQAPRVRIVYPERHLGIAGHYQHLVAAAKGTHLTMLSSDDALHPTFVAIAKRQLARMPDLGLLALAGFHCDARMRPVSRFGGSYPRQRMDPPLGCQYFLPGCRYLISFAVWDRAALLRTPRLPDEAALATDWYWALRVGASRAVGYSRQPGGYYRLHGENASQVDRSKWERHARGMLAFLRDENALPCSLREQLEHRIEEQQGYVTGHVASPAPPDGALARLKAYFKWMCARIYRGHPSYLQ